MNIAIEICKEVLNWISKKIGVGLVFGLFFILVGIGTATGEPKPGKEQDSPIPFFVLGGVLIMLSLVHRFRRRGHLQGPTGEPMAFEDVLRSPIRWVGTRVGWWGLYGGLCLIIGAVGLFNAPSGRNPLMDDEKKPVEEADIAGTWIAGGLFTAVGVVLLLIQIVKSTRRKEEASPVIVLEGDLPTSPTTRSIPPSTKYQKHGVALEVPSHWKISDFPLEGASGVWRILVDPPHGWLTVDVYPSSSPEVIGTCRNRMKTNSDYRDLSFTATSRTLGGRKASGYRFTCKFGGDYSYSGELLGLMTSQRTIVLFWQLADEDQAKVGADLTKVRDSLCLI